MKHHPFNSAVDRATEYIDSPRMTHRIVYRRQVSARIDGNDGIYRTTAQTGRQSGAFCTCPSDFRPCKHVHALRATWKEHPASFFNLDVFLKQLVAKPATELVVALRDVLLAYPEALTALGVPGFEADPEELDTE